MCHPKCDVSAQEETEKYRKLSRHTVKQRDRKHMEEETKLETRDKKIEEMKDMGMRKQKCSGKGGSLASCSEVETFEVGYIFESYLSELDSLLDLLQDQSILDLHCKCLVQKGVLLSEKGRHNICLTEIKMKTLLTAGNLGTH